MYGTQNARMLLAEMLPEHSWQNYQMKSGSVEGEDYMLVDKAIHDFLVNKYDRLNEIKRFGIQDEDGETIVEIYLK